MANLNKVMLIGRLTRDPELKYIPSGAAVAEFGFAVNRYYNTPNGERKEDTCFLEISAWGKLGETVNSYLRKGRQVYVEGHLTYSEWQTQEGQKRSRIRVVAETVQFLDSTRSETRSEGQANGRPGGAQDYGGGSGQAGEGQGYSPGPDAGTGPAQGGNLDEECPF